MPNSLKASWQRNKRNVKLFSFVSLISLLVASMLTMPIAKAESSPVASDGSASTTKNAPASITLSATDPDGDPLAYYAVAPPVHGTLTIKDNVATYSPDRLYYGSDSFTFKTNDWMGHIGATWTPGNIARGWQDIAMSASGQYQTSTAYGEVSVSSDYGQTWQNKSTNYGPWKATAMSADGQYQIAALNGGALYVSSNYGQNWTSKIKDAGRYWYDAAISADGQYQTAIVNGGQIYISSDYGQTWVPKDQDRGWRAVDMTADGKTQVVAALYDKIYISNDYGQTWTAGSIVGTWYGIAISADGKYQTATANGAKLYVSSDYGQTWAQKDSPRNWQALAMSDDGKIQMAGVWSGGYLYLSKDYGQTWTPTATDATRMWYGVAMSAEGRYQTGIASGNYQYISHAEGSDSNVAMVSLTVVNVNNAPVVSNTSISTDEDVPASAALSATDADEDILAYSIVTPPAHGTATISGGTATYAPNAGYYGSDSFTFRASDWEGHVGASWTSLDGAHNFQDVAMSADTKYQTAASFGELLVSSDYGQNWELKGPHWSWQGVDMSANGQYQTVTVLDGPLAVSSDYGQTWTNKLTDAGRRWYKVAMSASGQHQTALIEGGQIYVSSDYGQTWFAKDQSRQWRWVDMTPDGQTQVAVELYGPIYVSSDYGQTWNVESNINQQWYGIAISDNGQYQTATVNGGQIYVSSDYGQTWTAKESARNWYDIDMSANGQVQMAGVWNGGYLYVSTDYGQTWKAKATDAQRRWYGIDMSVDGRQEMAVVFGDHPYISNYAEGGDSNIATVSVTVIPSNHAPVASDISVSTEEDIAKNIILPVVDEDGDDLTYSIATPPAHGTVTLSGDVAAYVPAANYHGSDSFAFKANDGQFDSGIATVSISVVSVNDAPVAKNGTLNLDEGSTATVTLSATDADGDSLAYSVSTQPAHGAVTISGNVATYVPAANYYGPDSFEFKASDGQLDSNVATISITVSYVNHAPVAQDGMLTAKEGSSASIALSATDADGDPLTYSVVAPPAYGTVTISGNTATYVPAANYYGEDSFTFKANDGQLDSNAATVSILVNQLNLYEEIQSLYDYIASLPNSYFKGKNDKTQSGNKDHFLDALVFVQNKVEAGNYTPAINHINEVLLKKCDGSLGGNENDAWLIEPSAQIYAQDALKSLLSLIQNAAAAQEGVMAAVTPNVTGQARVEQRRNKVSNAVQQMLQIADRNGGLGEQVRTIAQAQTQNQEKLEANLQKIGSRGKVARFFFGPNYGEAKKAGATLQQSRDQISQLEEAKNQVENETDRQIISDQISQLEEVNADMGQSLQDSQKGFSLLGWMFRLFAR